MPINVDTWLIELRDFICYLLIHNINLKDNKIIDTSERLIELFKTTHTDYLKGDMENKKALLNLLCLNFLYDGEKLVIMIKEAFRPLVDIASFISGGLGEIRTLVFEQYFQ